MKKGILFDRDGTLIKERGDYNFLPEHLEILPDVIENLKILSESGYLLFVVTNQGGIAKGRYGHKDVIKLHNIMKDEFASHGIMVKDWLYCPHHHDHSRCLCRKPESLLLEKIIAAHGLDPSKSWMTGDADRDCQAGDDAGLNTFLLEPNEGLTRFVRHLKN